MKFKAFIFDMDGTIIDTEHIWAKASRDLVEARGVVITNELLALYETQIHGLALIKSCLFLKELFNLPDDTETLIQEKSQRAVTLYKQEVRFINGFREFHEKVVKKGLKHGVATNADEATIRATDESLNLKQFFGEHIYGISHVNNICKPSPDIYLHVAEKLNVHPSECMILEDSAHGIQAGLSAGMYCIGINSSNNPNLIAKAHHKVEGYHELDLDALLIKK
jgi:HAD superfamily hydrolase (TIGR01509 family)